MQSEKTIKLSKKVKTKSFKQIINLCIENELYFNYDETFLLVENKSWESVSFAMSDFGKEFTIKEVTLEFNNGELVSEVYESKKRSISSEFSSFFHGFPKLTKEQRSAPPVPPPPKVLNKLKNGEGHKDYDFVYLDNDTLKVGCHKFNKKQIKNIFTFLGECLDYDIEK